MKELTMMDKGFLLSESREVPMHVGGVALYTLPKGANAVEFLHDLGTNIQAPPPFRRREGVHPGRQGAVHRDVTR